MHKFLWHSKTANCPRVKNACLGVEEVQLGLPLPASKIFPLNFSLLRLANSINLSLNSKGLILP